MEVVVVVVGEESGVDEAVDDGFDGGVEVAGVGFVSDGSVDVGVDAGSGECEVGDVVLVSVVLSAFAPFFSDGGEDSPVVAVVCVEHWVALVEFSGFSFADGFDGGGGDVDCEGVRRVGVHGVVVSVLGVLGIRGSGGRICGRGLLGGCGWR